MVHIAIQVIPVKKDRLDEYKKMAKISAKLFKKYGAISYSEALEEDVQPGKLTSFPQSLKLKEDEIIAVAVATFKTKKQYELAWKTMMTEPFFANFDMKNAPFDLKRMYFGGFKTIASI
jgi:uncharacterized protein YbaA (DUF1428 family)